MEESLVCFCLTFLTSKKFTYLYFSGQVNDHGFGDYLPKSLNSEFDKEKFRVNIVNCLDTKIFASNCWSSLKCYCEF